MQALPTWKTLPVPVLVLSPCTCVTELASLLFCPCDLPTSVSTEVLFCVGVLVFPTLQGSIQVINNDVNKNTSTFSSSLSKA